MRNDGGEGERGQKGKKNKRIRIELRGKKRKETGERREKGKEKKTETKLSVREGERDEDKEGEDKCLTVILDGLDVSFFSVLSLTCDLELFIFHYLINMCNLAAAAAAGSKEGVVRSP